MATSAAGSGDEAARGSDQAASAGPPPPWQRAGSRSESGARPESGPRPAEGDQRSAARPATGPVPTGGGDQRPGTPAAGTPRPSPPGPPPSGPIPTGNQRPSPPSGPLPAQGEQRRSNTALIDAPTNQLSPEQLGMRSSGRAPEPEPDLDDIEEDVRSSRPSRGKVPRRASLQVKRFDPWSVLKLALVLGVALFFVWMFAVGVLYAVLDGMGVWAQLNGTYQDLTSDSGGAGQLITAGGVFGIAAIVGVVNTILFTALASVSAFIYNISADVAGGIEVTLSERD
ncbi:DUF3566 domain-containing protein [Actinomycetospora endophytica]|uniref:DUF3566 domain-containing protein n=1 Tax=Actinomycetospora endophytica TaxID=2291215 RepID=UPI003FD813E8